MLSAWIRSWSGPPAFQVFGKTRRERNWRVIDVYATPRRDLMSGWPFWRGTCTCWSADLIAVGCDFARAALRCKHTWLASRERPIAVFTGSFRNQRAEDRLAAGLPAGATHAEVLAHEIGHTGQALRYRMFYLLFVGALTLFGEGPRPWNRFENEASAKGQFGGIVNGSVSPAFLSHCMAD